MKMVAIYVWLNLALFSFPLFFFTNTWKVPILNLGHRYFFKELLPFFFMGLWFWFSREKSSRLNHIFNWKVWITFSFVVASLALFNWQFNTKRNFDTFVLGYDWQWGALFTWSIFFAIEMFLYKRKKIGSLNSFCLSFYGLFLASFLYEAPHGFPFEIKYTWVIPIGLLMFIIILDDLKWKPPRFWVFSFIPMIILFLISPIPYNFYWIPRLTVYPIFLLIPFGCKN